MNRPLHSYAADHRYLLEAVARAADFKDPVAVDLDDFGMPLIKAARKGQMLPVDGVLVRDWDPDNRKFYPGLRMGLRVYHVEGLRFVRVRFQAQDDFNCAGLDFIAVDRCDYRKLYKIALRCRRDFEPPSEPPVLPLDQAELLWNNTIGYLDRANLSQIRKYGGRAKRGVLLTGAPGNG